MTLSLTPLRRWRQRARRGPRNTSRRLALGERKIVAASSESGERVEQQRLVWGPLVASLPDGEALYEATKVIRRHNRHDNRW